MANPVTQFEIKPLIPIEIAGADVSYTNSALAMTGAVLIATVFLTMSMRGRALVPGRLQGFSEMLYQFIAGMLDDNVGREGRPYFPFVFSLFVFIMLGNLIGLLPYSFTFTSHLAVNFSLALFIFLAITALGFIRHGVRFFGLFFPQGAPIAAAPILIPIEIISYLARPFSLAIRLFANMTAGHIMLKVLATLALASGVVLGILPFLFISAVVAFEILVSLLQAYVFTILTCIYLNDAIHLH